MNGRTIMLLTLAIGFGLGAMFLTRQLLSEDGSKKPEETEDVVVALRDVKEEEVLKPEMVKLISMVKSAKPVGAFSAIKDVEERWVKTSLLEGDVLVEKKLGARGAPPGLVANIPKGMRAIAVEVTEQTGVSGFILPGHHVDVVHFEGSERKEMRGQTILQNVLVLAAGQVFTRPEERSLVSRTVTLALKPDDAEILVAARNRGMLALSLRGVNDDEVIKHPTRVVAKPEVAVEPDPRWKIEEEKRLKLEQQMNQLQELVARNASRIPEPPSPRLVQTLAVRPKRFVWVYRSAQNDPKKISMDEPGVTTLGSPSPLDLDPDTRQSARPFGVDATPEPEPGGEPRN